MNKPVWKSRKVWIAVVALLAVVVAQATGNNGLADAVTLLGGVLVAAFGLSDLGKEGKAIAGLVELQLWEKDKS